MVFGRDIGAEYCRRAIGRHLVVETRYIRSSVAAICRRLRSTARFWARRTDDAGGRRRLKTRRGHHPRRPYPLVHIVRVMASARLCYATSRPKPTIGQITTQPSPDHPATPLSIL